MTIDEIKELIHVLMETGIAELEVERNGNRVRIRRAMAPAQDMLMPTVVPVAVSPAQAAIPTTMSIPQAIAPAAEAPQEPTRSEHDVVVKSPIVGTYYDAPAPGAATFVKVGDIVEPKRVLCIIESMKLMNEIEAEIAGTVIAKLVESGRPVEYGESLFTIRPLNV